MTDSGQILQRVNLQPISPSVKTLGMVLFFWVQMFFTDYPYSMFFFLSFDKNSFLFCWFISPDFMWHCWRLNLESFFLFKIFFLVKEKKMLCAFMFGESFVLQPWCQWIWEINQLLYSQTSLKWVSPLSGRQWVLGRRHVHLESVWENFQTYLFFFLI